MLVANITVVIFALVRVLTALSHDASNNLTGNRAS
uniref:G-protein coupled receptors family 1 profile domain-containing protein n=1 Tax=Anguilla anguilla TaxID=7936 RepID=A0A0E9WCV9_ANGAN